MPSLFSFGKLGSSLALVLLGCASVHEVDDSSARDTVGRDAGSDAAPSCAPPIAVADAAVEADAPRVVVATIVGFRFPEITVPAGTTVRWVNASMARHTVTSGASSAPADAPGSLFDGVVRPGASFEHTFDAAGDVPYFCRPHEGSGMTGVVHVTP